MEENFQLQQYLQNCNKRRINALANQDPTTYTLLCAQLGIVPEDPLLIERCIAELYYQRYTPNKKQKPSTLENKIDYLSFLRKSENINVRDFGVDADVKKDLLRKYFPRFRIGNIQDLTDYSNTEVGHIFSDMVTYATKNTIT